jgi:RNA polymerase sigma factor (sigma-70 family)
VVGSYRSGFTDGSQIECLEWESRGRGTAAPGILGYGIVPPIGMGDHLVGPRSIRPPQFKEVQAQEADRMTQGSIDATSLNNVIAGCLARLAAGEPRAREDVLEVCMARLHVIASRMLADFPVVRRWNDTGDVLQGGLVRLHRALADVQPGTPRDLLALATKQMHRELIDLARKYAGPRSHAANHDTNSIRGVDRVQKTDLAANDHSELDRWTAFHDVVEGLPPKEREVFRLVWYFGCEQQQVAETLGCSTRTVKRHWQAAREAVSAALGEPPA